MANLLLLNGPNLNLLGSREPAVYGSDTLPQIVERLANLASDAGHVLADFQSNSEGALIDRIHQAKRDAVDFILFNPGGGYTHTSIALLDAFLGVSIPFIEVHLSNIHARETFRHHSYFSGAAKGVIVGFGPLGYELALYAAMQKLARS